MKRMIAFLVAALMLLACLTSCELLNKLTGKETEAPTESEKKKDDDTSSKKKDDETSSKKEDDTTKKSDDNTTKKQDDKKPDYVYSKDTVYGTEKWGGKNSLDVYCTLWYGGTSIPWAPVELCVTGYASDGNAQAAATINDAVWERNLFIKDTYGVDVNWIAGSDGTCSIDIMNALTSAGVTTYDIFMPRLLETQDLVTNGMVYDMGSSKYIDLDQPYYSQTARDEYSINGRTFFVCGDFNYLVPYTTYLLYYNESLASTVKNFPDLYDMVRDGEWTVDEMIKLAKNVSKDNGDGVWDDTDTYGLASNGMNSFMYAFGNKQVTVEEGLYTLSMNDDLILDIIEKIKDIKTQNYTLENGWSAAETAFAENRALFYQEVIQKFDNLRNYDNPDFRYGAIPLPKFSEDQEEYRTVTTYQAVALGIPRCTANREMSEYFIDVISWTGTSVMDAFTQELMQGGAAGNEDMKEMLEDYIFPNVVYDQGSFYGWSGLLNSVRDDSLGGLNEFSAAYVEAAGAAQEKITEWNLAWSSYDDELEF